MGIGTIGMWCILQWSPFCRTRFAWQQCRAQTQAQGSILPHSNRRNPHTRCSTHSKSLCRYLFIKRRTNCSVIDFSKSELFSRVNFNGRLHLDGDVQNNSNVYFMILHKIIWVNTMKYSVDSVNPIKFHGNTQLNTHSRVHTVYNVPQQPAYLIGTTMWTNRGSPL